LQDFGAALLVLVSDERYFADRTLVMGDFCLSSSTIT
jgi:hypothetical protein